MAIDKGAVYSEIDEVITLSYFKNLCEANNTSERKQRLRKIYKCTTDIKKTTREILRVDLNENVTDENELSRLSALILAFLKKNSQRKPIDERTKNALLITQNYKCAVCGATIDKSAHVDHCVPFKYVGDELDNNYQMLCTKCNLQKNASIDYQMRYLLKLTKKREG